MFYFNVSILFFFLLEEDSDEIKIGTSCKNGGCSKVYITKFVLRLEVKFLFWEESNLLTQLDTNIYVPVMCWALFHGAGLWAWVSASPWGVRLIDHRNKQV